VTWRIRLRRWGQRNPALATSVVSILLLILAALGVSLFLLGERADALSEKTAALARYEQMSDAALVADLEERAAELWPRRPHLVPAMDRWLREARELHGRLADHQAALAELRTRAAPYDAEQEEADRLRRRELHPELFGALVAARREIGETEEESARLVEEMAALEERIARRPAEVLELRLEKMGARRRELAALLEERRSEASALESDPRLAERLTWRIPDPASRWRHQVISDLVRDLVALGPLIEEIGDRRAYAAEVSELSIEVHRSAWNRCLSAIAEDDRYRGRAGQPAPQPVVGLVPLGVDRDSGLWEFWHLDSGERPGWEGPAWEDDEAADPRGRAVVDEACGVVLVLVPKGRFLMGATREPRMPNHDPRALGLESPVCEVTLDPFLIAKHEVTQAQWERLFGSNPSTYLRGGSNYLGGVITGRHPVTNIDWQQARDAVRRWDLDLPTEAQWEYACRAGTRTVYWCGDAVVSIGETRAGNVADRTASQATPAWSCTLEVEDGHLVHAPVGNFAPNAFGLHDVLGNVMEWCRDRLTPYAERPRPGDGLRDTALDSRRVFRGGSFYRDVSGARSATRNGNDPSLRYGDLGLRPARALTP
jgi:formylglycine-generating enzyme required for sulfatase activity